LLNLKNKKNASDEELVKIIVQSNRHDDFGILYDRYSDKVYHKCISFVKDLDEAKDLTHDIFLKTFLNLSKFSHKAKFSTWLYSLTYNFCIDYMRKNNKIRKEPEEALRHISDDDEAQLERELMQMKAERLTKVLDTISVKDKMVLLMKYQDDMPITEMMDALECNESAVKMLLKRAKAKAVGTYKTLYGDE
jgi:RNA polymerase sigma factor (sigma-70 family)